MTMHVLKRNRMMLFKKGMYHLENTAYSKENVYIWKYYYARACKSVTLITSTNDINACQLYLSVLGNLSKENKRYAVYRARAYVCIGHRLVAPKEVRKADLKKSSLSNDELFQVLMNDPLSAFSYANAEHTDDAIVLNRKGKSLLFVIKFGSEHAKTTEHQKQKHLTEAIKALSLSLSINPRLDHLNFSLRMNVYFDMSNLKQIYNDSRFILLQKALEDDKAAIHVNLKGKVVCKVSEICQRLAKFPKYFFYGPKSVTNKEYLTLALDYLNQYICTKGQPYTLAFAIGTIHFDMGKFRSALEWHKRAFLLSDYKRATSTCSNVRKLCLCILRLKETTSVHIEFINALTFIASKLDKLEFVDTLVPNNLWNEYHGKLLGFLVFLKTFPLTQKQVEIAEHLKNVLLEKPRISAPQLRKYQYTPSTRNIEDKWITSSFSHPVIGPASDHLDFEYDYFAIMSHDNSGWIECFLQQQLNTQMLYNDRTFTACPDVINYESCSTFLETTINGINKSQKAIVVLSNYFLTIEWNAMKSIITEMLQRRQGSLLIILLENCDVPPEIDSEQLMYFDFSDEKNIPMEIQNLKLALLSV